MLCKHFLLVQFLVLISIDSPSFLWYKYLVFFFCEKKKENCRILVNERKVHNIVIMLIFLLLIEYLLLYVHIFNFLLACLLVGIGNLHKIAHNK